MIAAIEAGQLLEVVWVSLAAGIGATVLFAMVVFGSSRASEARRAGGNPTVYGLMVAALLIALLALVALALGVILNKQ